MNQRMEFTGVKVLKRNRLNSVIKRNDFNKSVLRRDEKRVDKFQSEVEKSIDEINDIMVAEEIFNTKVAHLEGERMHFEILHLYLATPGAVKTSNIYFYLSVGLLSAEQLKNLRDEFLKEWNEYYFDMQLISWNEWQRELEGQDRGETVNAVGIMYKKIMREVRADERAIIGVNDADYKAKTREELNRWVKKMGIIKPIVKLFNKFDLTVHEIKVRNYGREVKIVKMILAVKTKDDGYFGGWDVLNYERERLKEEWRVLEARKIKN